MGRLSLSRNDSSTAFFNHWLTCHWPLFFSATRALPLSSSVIACSTASRISAGALFGLSSARRSKAASMTEGRAESVIQAILKAYRDEILSQRSPRSPRRIPKLQISGPWRSWRSLRESFRSAEIPDAFGGVHALRNCCHERDAHAAAARIAVRSIARDVAAR